MQRRKNTIACETCRNRKGKCSGTAPCTVCRRLGLTCEFRTNRQRRGPRPKSLSDTKEIPGAPTRGNLLPVEHSDILPGGEMNVSSDQESPGANLPLRIDSTQMPTWESCRDDLAEIIDVEIFHHLGSEELNKTIMLNIMCHLIDLFWSHVHTQQCRILQSRGFYQSVRRKQCPDFLCLAICASAVHFSCHPILSKHNERTDWARLFALEARRRIYTHLESQPLSRIQALCILTLYDAAHARGVQACVDNAAAQSIGASMRMIQDLQPEYLEALIDAEQFLVIHQHLHALGNPSLIDKCLTQIPIKKDRRSFNDQSIWLLGLLARSQQLSNDDCANIPLPPWNSKSRFSSIWRELEAFRLQHPERLALDPNSLNNTRFPSGETAAALFCATSWHCTVVALHRSVFNHVSMWIPETTRKSSENGSSGSPSFSGSFWKEHINICSSSLSAIARICAQILKNEVFLFPPILAYACFQSAIVTIIFLRSGIATENGLLQQILDVYLAILAITKQFYKPAYFFDSLQQLQALEVLHEASHDFGATDDLYAGHVPEPPYLPMSLQLSLSSTTQESDSSASKEPKTGDSITKDASNDTRPSFPLQYYQSMLEEEIDIELNTVNPQITSNNTETSPPGRQQGFVTHGDMEADGNNDILPPSTYLELYENRPSAEPLPSVFTTDMLSLDLLLAEGLSPGPEIDLDDIDLDGMQHWSQIFHTP